MGSETARPAPATGSDDPVPRDDPTIDTSIATTPLAPLLVLRPDPLRGTIRVRGQVDGPGSELLAACVGDLRRRGHRVVSVQLDVPVADRTAAEGLARLTRQLAREGVVLTVE
jgi:hypothetical protein